MARKHQNKIAKPGLAVLGVLVSCVAALAQEAAAPAVPAPFSQDCQIGNEQIVEQSPLLPNVAAALQKRKQIRILAIGSSSSLGRRSSSTGGPC